jgi:broad specificity phosphatase PhoE
MANYYYLRHGQSTANVEKIVAGWTDVELTQNGVDEAHAMGDEIVSKGMSFDMVFSSPLSRALITAQIVSTKIGYQNSSIRIHEGLKEKSGGAYELRPVADFYGMHENELAAAGAETAQQFRERVVSASREIHDEAGECDNVLIVAHAGLYKIAAVTVEGRVPTDMYKLTSPPNAKLLRFPLKQLIGIDGIDLNTTT